MGKHKALHIKSKCLHACVRLRALSTHHADEKTVDAHTSAGLKHTVKRAVFHASDAGGGGVVTTTAAAAAAHDGGACNFGGRGVCVGGITTLPGWHSAHCSLRSALVES